MEVLFEIDDDTVAPTGIESENMGDDRFENVLPSITTDGLRFFHIVIGGLVVQFASKALETLVFWGGICARFIEGDCAVYLAYGSANDQSGNKRLTAVSARAIAPIGMLPPTVRMFSDDIFIPLGPKCTASVASTISDR